MNTSDYHDLLQFCADEGLATPPLSAALAGAVRRIGTRAFGASIDTPAGEDSFYLGCAGYGIDNNALSYELRYGPLTLLLSRRLGNAYDDASIAVRRIARAFELAADIMTLTDKLADAGKLVGQRLVIVDTGNDQAGWAWVDVGREENAVLANGDEPSPMRAALQSLMDKENGHAR